MKKIKFSLLSIITVVLLISCNNSTQQKTDSKSADNDAAYQAEQDWLAKEEEEQAERERRAWLDSMAVFAWGDVKFGMTEKEVRKTKSLGDKNYKQNLIESLNLNGKILTIIPSFDGKRNGLTSLHISSSRHIDYLDELKEDLNTLYNEFRKKYGEPTGVQNSPLSISASDILSKSWTDIAYWNIGSKGGKYGTKHINLHIKECSYGGGYYEYYIEIHNPNFTKDYKPQTQEDIDKDKEHKKEVDAAKDNAF